MKKKLHSIFQLTQSIPSKELDQLARETTASVFKKVDCLECGNCCKSAPPIVTPLDIKRIARFFGESPKKIKKKYTITDHNGEMSFMTVPCVFLGKDNYCSIYEARPEACRDYPHTDSGHFNARRKLHTINKDICPAVDQILQLMQEKIKQNYS